MGYEVKLIIGYATSPTPEYKNSEKGEIDGDYIYYPTLKDKNGKDIKTGRQEYTFLTAAEIDLKKIGAGALADLVDKNEKQAAKDEKNVYKWFNGNTLIEEDCYGKKKIPVPIKDVIKAIETDNTESYRRYDWALALLKSMETTSPGEFSVIFYGH